MNALDQFKLWSLSPRLAVVKCATTGLGSSAEVVEVTVASGAGEVLFYTNVRPTVPVEDGAAQFHGLTDEVLANYPDWSVQWPALASVLRGRRVVAYNADFDARLLRQSLNPHRAALFDGPMAQPDSFLYPDELAGWECVMNAYAEVVGEPNARGGYRAQKFLTAIERERVTTDEYFLSRLAGRSPACGTARDAIRTVRLIHAVAGRWPG